MDVEAALELAKRLILAQTGKPLNDSQIYVLQGALEGKTLGKIAESSYNDSYVKEVSTKLCKLLTAALGTPITKRNLISALEQRLRLEKQNSEAGLIQVEGVIATSSVQKLNFVDRENAIANIPQDWGEAPDVSAFYAREDELVTLEQWIITNKCRLVALLGMGGIGKTAISVKLAQNLAEIPNEFQYIIWRSLRESPPLEKILIQLIKFLSNQQETDLPNSIGEKIALLINYFRASRCLVVLDNMESLLQSGNQAGQYREGYQEYSDLLKRIGESSHQSCLVITSREKPAELAPLESATLFVRVFRVIGLKSEALKILESKGLFGSEDEMLKLIEIYSGNPLALNIVASSINELFNGNITDFLSEQTSVFNGIRNLLDQQFNRLSDIEKSIMYWLAINREPVSVTELRDDLVPSIKQPKLLESLEYLRWRSLIERSELGFTLQNVVMEYMTERLIEQVSLEITTGKFELFNTHALIKAMAKDYVRDTQIRLILKPIADNMIANKNISIEEWAKEVLPVLQSQSHRLSGYIAGNVLNLLVQNDRNLCDYDFAHLTVWQAYLKDANLHNINFTKTDLSKSAFSDTMSAILVLNFSKNGKLLATGDDAGEMIIWEVENRRKLLARKVQIYGINSLTFSPDGSILASGSGDGTLKLWDIRNIDNCRCLVTLQEEENFEQTSAAFSPDGQILASGNSGGMIKLWNTSNIADKIILQTTLPGHIRRVRSIAFSPDGKTLASSSTDGELRLWNTSNGECLSILQANNQATSSVTFSPDGQILATGSADCTASLWDVRNPSDCKHIITLQDHKSNISSVSFSPDGNFLVTGSWDQTLKLWDIRDLHNCKYLTTLEGHTSYIHSVAFSPNGKMLASGSDGNILKFWEITLKNDALHIQCIDTFRGYSNWINCLTFNPQGQFLASATNDMSVRLWDISSEQCLILQEHKDLVRSVAFSSDGKTLASGSYDATVKLWDVQSGKCFVTLDEHKKRVFSVAFSPDGRTLASGSFDYKVKLWDVNSGECLATLDKHISNVFTVAFSPNKQILASGGSDSLICVWDLSSHECKNSLTLDKQTLWVSSVAFSPDGQILASGSGDSVVRLWNPDTGELLGKMEGHTSALYIITFSPDGKMLASSSGDKTVRLWDVETRKCLFILEGHLNWVHSVAFSPDGLILASGGGDETIKLWNVKTGQYIKELRSPRPYEGMNIFGVTGLTDAQKATLKTLGAVENQE
jgi:WD40 repeat protein